MDNCLYEYMNFLSVEQEDDALQLNHTGQKELLA